LDYAERAFLDKHFSLFVLRISDEEKSFKTTTQGANVINSLWS